MTRLRLDTCGTPARTFNTVLLLFLVSAGLASPALAATPSEEFARAQELLDAGRVEESIAILDRLVKKKPPNAQAFLLRSTANFVLGDTEAGAKDLDKALEIDAGLRQGWLNRAALDISEQQYDRALAALRNAKKLDAAASDNDLNIGAVLLLQGNLEAASSSFKIYLTHNSRSSDAYYLVATNYAMAGFAGPAIQNLNHSIDLDEKSRMRARTDANFEDLEGNPRFRQVLNSDTYLPPAGSFVDVFLVDTPYEGSDGQLLRAVLDALQLSGIPFNPRVEVTDLWALIWSEMRIKVSNSPEGKGQIQFSAPANRMTPSQWQSRIENLKREITVHLATRSR